MRKLTIAAGLVGVSVVVGTLAAKALRGPVGNKAVPAPAKDVELYRYMGRWYEQFRYEASFERGMDEVTAHYSLREDGSVEVTNRGRTAGESGRWKESVGTGKVVDPDTGAKLKVSFFGPFFGDYWVLDHGDDYDWSIVGEPTGRYLWVLTRVVRPSNEVLGFLEERVRELGYDWSLIRRTHQ
ncbi:lipocalin family protein [Novosphingobium terrae]|uniref:lipocalin family protein n=1 Tax=Novosphingobium terrae TaxID=2726189 RepID=UPI0019805C4E|nr:lipocalin family protein [Novosphingobium terrae]